MKGNFHSDSFERLSHVEKVHDEQSQGVDYYLKASEADHVVHVRPRDRSKAAVR